MGDLRFPVPGCDRPKEGDWRGSGGVRRVLGFLWLFLFCGASGVLPRSEAASVADILAQARQAQARAREIKGRGWGFAEKQQAIQVIGPVALRFLSASDLAEAAASKSQRAQVREIYETLNAPLEEIYTSSFNRLNSLSKAVMDQDGDLEALYETQEWKDNQLIASQSLYFLNWLRYVGSFVSGEQERKRLLEEASKGFSEFAVGEQSSQLKRESLFGRALCEKELRRFDWAIRDLELLLKDPALPADMENKVRTALADARKRDARGERASEAERAESAAEAQARAMYQRAQGLFASSKKAKGDARTKQRWEALALLDELRKQGGDWKKKADALAQAEVSEQEAAAWEEEKNPFPQWGQARAYLQKSEFAKAVPLLQEVLASHDPKAVRRHHEARYFLGVGLFQRKDYREAARQLAQFLGADGTLPQYAPEAAYLRFKAAEALYAREVNEENEKLYVDAMKDFLRRAPNHKAAFEAYFRLGEYHHAHQQYLQAVEAYQKVSGDPAFRVRADYATLQCYFSLLDALNAQRNGVGMSEGELRARVATGLRAFWQNHEALTKSNPELSKRDPYREYPGRVAVMNAVFLSKEVDRHAEEVIALLDNFEQKYPEQKDAFAKVARMRLVAYEKAGRFVELEHEVNNIFSRFSPEEQQELLAGLSQVLPADIRSLEKRNDRESLLAAKRTLARLYEDRLRRGGAFAEDESPARFKYELAQLYLDVKDYDKAVPLYQELQQGAYSLVSLAGLAQIAEVKGDRRQALAYWEEMLKGTQVGDPLWFRGTFEVAQLHADQGNTDAACKTITPARPVLGRLGDQGLKKRIQDFAGQQCGK